MSATMGRGHMRSFALVVTLASLLPVARAGWIDIETPLNKRTTTSLIDGTEYHLVRISLLLVWNRIV
jgi:hypothetical protein